LKLVIKQLTKFVIIGISAVMVDLVVYYICSDVLGLNIDLAKGIGFLIGTVYTYYLNKRWTWKYTERSNHGMILKFAMVYLVSLVFNILINKYGLLWCPAFEVNFNITTLADAHVNNIITFKGHKFVAFFFATLVSAFINFLGQKYLVFKTSQLDPKDDTNIEVSEA
jgi:putative flippase GtrA